MDFTDPFAVHDVFEKFQPDVVVHAGAMSKPDECEQNQWPAYVTNVEGTLTMLLNTEEYRGHFIFLSTDFVFDGISGPYDEESKTGPVNFYGKTKLEAEDAVKEYPFNWTIVRTVLVYGKPTAGRSTILTIVKEKLENGEPYSAFDDLLRTPTYVEDLARAIVTIIEKKATGVFHISGKDSLSPYEMARRTAIYLKLDPSLIKRITAADWQQPAKRPPQTIFILDRARKELGYEPVSFETGLVKTFDQ
jgi:dTDP-4-dehydrorhamnose reductase